MSSVKKNLRQEVLTQMKAIPADKKNKVDHLLMKAFLAHPFYQKSQVLATYLAMSHEAQTQALIEHALADGKTVLIPKTYPKGRMIFVPYDSDNLRRTSFGLLEPVSDQAIDPSVIDLIHVPGVVYNKQGFRIGYGAGYYDRYLSDFDGHTLSTAYTCQKGEFTPDFYDQAVEEVIYAEND